MGRAARERGYEYLAICDHTPAVGAVRGLTADDVRRQARGDRRRQRAARAVPRPARDRVRHPPRRPARPPRRRPRRARLGAGQRARRAADAAARDDQARRGGAAQPVRALPQPSRRAGYINRRPENALDLERVFEVALEHGVALEVNGLPPRLDLSGEHVRDALRAGVQIVCSTDAHSTRGLGNMALSVAHGAPRLGDARATSSTPGRCGRSSTGVERRGRRVAP